MMTRPLQSKYGASISDRTSGPGPLASLNPCELEIDLFCKGLRIHPSCDLKHDARSVTRTRAGLGSGLELIILSRSSANARPLKDVWVNAPVVEAFAQRSCYQLTRAHGQYAICDDRTGFAYPVRLPPMPAWYNRTTASGVQMRQVGVLQGTCLSFYISNTCGFWYHSPSLHCRFCTTGLNVGVNEIASKSVEDIVEVAAAAREESGVTLIHFNSGYHSHRDLDVAAPYVKAVKSRVGGLIGLQLAPTRDLWKYDRLIDLGVDHFSFCYEFQNPEYFAQFLPGKARFIGQELFFRALEYTSRQLGKGRCSGEIIAGIEPLEDTRAAIDYIAGVGAFPTVCVFRPTVGSDMEEWPPPRYEDMLIVFRHLYEACRRNQIPIDVAPNIEVSLVVQPGDTRYLAPRTWASRWYDFKMAVARRLARPYFWRCARPRTIAATDILAPP